MKKLKWFTLVEILIVIVIIGILIGALVPRMQSAQWRARDVARKNDLAQLQAAILVSYQDKGNWPAVGSAYDDAIDIDQIESEILAAWMNGLPMDPLKWNTFAWLWNGQWSGWQYRYMVIDSYGSPKWWFLLMAKTEVEWGSNWVACDNGQTTEHNCNEKNGTNQPECEEFDEKCSWNDTDETCGWGAFTLGSSDSQWILKVDWTTHPDVQNIKPCSSLTKVSGNWCTNDWQWHACSYSNESQLRYILIN